MCAVVVVERCVDGKLGVVVVRDERAWRCGGGGWMGGIGDAWKRTGVHEGKVGARYVGSP